MLTKNFDRSGLALLLILLPLLLLVASSAPARGFLPGGGDGGQEARPRANQTKELPRPSPQLSPAEVIGIQLRALKDNDAEDGGLAIVFSFASPSNRFVTGPLERFIKLVKNPVYRPMLNHRATERKPIEISGGAASQRVVIVDAQGETATFVFVLTKQVEEPFKDCWMTDGVERVEDDSRNQIIAQVDEL
ncbi:MAG: DUF4864 domain-containing protein [Pyrinomonadaceae bacterium]